LLFKVIADVTDKVSTLIGDTFIYTDEQKALDAQIKSSNQVIAAYAAQIMQLDDAYAKMGKTASQQTAIDIGKLQVQLNAANEAVYRLTGDVKEAKEKAADPNNINAIGNAMALPGLNDQLGKAQQLQKVIFDQMRNLTETFKEQQNAELLAIAEAEISGRLRVQEASVNAEKTKWDRIKELTHTTADENVSVETGFENRLYQVKREALSERLGLMKLDPERNGAQIATLNRDIEALAKGHEAALTRIKIEGDQARKKEQNGQQAELARQNQEIMQSAKAENDAAIKAADDQLKAWDESYKGQIEVAKVRNETDIQLIEQQLAKGQITQQQEVALVAKAKENELALEIFYQQQRQALWDKDPKKVQEIQNEINKIKAQSELVAAKGQTDSLKLQEKNLDQFFSKVKSAMDQSIKGFLTGTESFSKAWQNLWSGMVVSMAEKLADMLLKWIEHHVALLVIHTTEKENEVATEAAASAQSKSISLADSLAKIHHSAASAAGRVYDAEAYLGPVIAGLLAAGTYTAVLGFGAMASAEGGQYIVPNNQLTMLHPQEMVLPAGIANQMRSVIGGGGTGGSGVTVVVNHSVSAVDASSFQGHIRRHSNMIANEVTRALKRKGVTP
jgi:hypothetical protein